jgi:hypothetical protein
VFIQERMAFKALPERNRREFSSKRAEVQVLSLKQDDKPSFESWIDAIRTEATQMGSSVDENAVSLLEDDQV